MYFRSLMVGGLMLLAVLMGTLLSHSEPLVASTPVASATSSISSSAVYVPDVSLSGRPLPDGFFEWDALMKSAQVTNGLDFARFEFNFTNSTTGNLTILNVHPSCGCTTAELPPTPWTLPAGTTGQIKLKVNLSGKTGKLFKSVTITTDKGTKTLTLIIDILPMPAIQMSEADLEHGIMAAKVDRQAVFHGDCASCHNKNLGGKYGQQLFAAACAICHEGEHRASMVPDLRHLTVPTNIAFWRTWITGGKPGSLMPAFAQDQGGPLTDIQIASLAQYLNAVNPSHVAPK